MEEARLEEEEEEEEILKGALRKVPKPPMATGTSDAWGAHSKPQV